MSNLFLMRLGMLILGAVNEEIYNFSSWALSFLAPISFCWTIALVGSSLTLGRRLLGPDTNGCRLGVHRCSRGLRILHTGWGASLLAGAMFTLRSFLAGPCQVPKSLQGESLLDFAAFQTVGVSLATKRPLLSIQSATLGPKLKFPARLLTAYIIILIN